MNWGHTATRSALDFSKNVSLKTSQLLGIWPQVLHGLFTKKGSYLLSVASNHQDFVIKKFQNLLNLIKPLSSVRQGLICSFSFKGTSKDI